LRTEEVFEEAELDCRAENERLQQLQTASPVQELRAEESA
jgi:hypothetical protein